jgi:hypothetical protein
MPQSIINGVPQNFGVPPSVNKKGAVLADDGLVRTVAYEFTYDDLPTNSSTDVGVHVFPAYSQIVEAFIIVETAFTGGTSYDIGLVQTDGTAIDTDGIFAALPIASINAKGEMHRALLRDSDGTGSLTDNYTGALLNYAGAVGASTPANLKVTATGSFTAGKAHLYVRYIAPPFA